MVLVRRKKYGINYYQKWFCDRIDPLDVFKFVAYRQVSRKNSFLLFHGRTVLHNNHRLNIRFGEDIRRFHEGNTV